MKTCPSCKNCFRNNYDLLRHMSRVTPCDGLKENTKKHTESLNGSLQSEIGKKENPKCIWCLNTFSRNFTLNEHLKICKLVNDPARKVEIDLGITPDLNSPVCRFCTKEYRCVSKHICKERDNYLEKLKKIPQGNSNVNNITINNNSNNLTNIDNSINITLNIHKKEDTENLNIELLIDELRKLNRLHGKENHFLIAGNLVVFLDGQITQKVENVNAFIENTKSLAGQLLTEKGWEIMPVDEIIDLKIKNTANKLVELRPDIDKHNPKVFQQQDSRLTMNQVEQIGMHGLRTTGKRGIKSKMKVNTIVNGKKIRHMVPDSDF